MKNHKTRESWLNQAMPTIAKWITAAGGQKFKAPLLSVGFPSTGSRGRRIGECWTVAAHGGRSHIFLHPTMAQPIQVLDVLTHELIHASIGLKAGHGPKFKKVALGVGLTGKMRSTVAGDELKKKLGKLSKTLGKFPHLSLSALKSPVKKQKTRMLKYECPGCNQIIRAATEDLQAECTECNQPFERA